MTAPAATLPDECPHSIALDPTTCSICLETAGVRRSETKHEIVPTSAVFVARYDGKCGGCNLPTSVGQLIRRWADDTYRHHSRDPKRDCSP